MREPREREGEGQEDYQRAYMDKLTEILDRLDAATATR